MAGRQSEVDQVIGELESQLVIISEAIRLLKTAKATKKPAAAAKRAKLKKVEKPSEAAS